MAKKKTNARSAESEQLQLGFGGGRSVLAKAKSKTPAAKPKKREAKKSMRAPDRPRALPKRATAESMAAEQRHISISEFFAKNRHLLGFDNNRKALLTTVKEAVDNSLDACEEAHILPEIRVEITQTDEDRYRVRVRDNGPGIDPEAREKIFSPLYTSKANGTGLGLSISRKLVEAHGGTIQLASAPGQGTEFLLAIPKQPRREERPS